MKKTKHTTIRSAYGKRLQTISIAALSASLMAGHAAAADVHWRVEVTGSENGKPISEITDIWANGDNIRMSIPGDGDALFLGAENKMVMIDHQEKQYMVMDATKVAAGVNAVKSEMDATMAAMLDGMDENTRAMVTAAMQNGMVPGGMPAGAMPNGLPGGMGIAAGPIGAPTYDVAKSDASYKVLGATAVAYDVKENGSKTSEIWAANVKDVKGGAIVRDRMKDMMGYMETAMGDFAPLSGGPFQFIEDIDNRVPVGSVEIEPDGGESRAKLILAEEKAAPAGTWSAPAEYKLMETPF
ncbi:MAG: hypothetical protein AAF224_03045 [Pseudomonadota bacterium]